MGLPGAGMPGAGLPGVRLPGARLPGAGLPGAMAAGDGQRPEKPRRSVFVNTILPDIIRYFWFSSFWQAAGVMLCLCV